MMKNKQDDFSVFQRKIAVRFFGSALLSVGIVIALYLFLWKERFGDWIVAILEYVGRMEHEEAFLIYHYNFRGYKEIFFVVAIVVVFLILLLLLFRWLTKYFREINAGIDNLVAEGEKKISLSPEMLPFEWKLNAVKQNLQQQKEATALAEQRKDELVMYLAHDIRTPLTSVIGYLSLLEEEPDMTTEEKEKNVHIALDKAYRLEKMVNEFFEITRYHSKQIKLEKQPVDLYYMLMQLRDEFLPSFSLHNNTVSLDLDENITIYADPEKIARVFGNIMKNAAAYSYPNTTIIIAATQEAQYTTISFQNKGKTIPGQPTNRAGKPYKEIYYNEAYIRVDDMDHVMEVQDQIRALGLQPSSNVEWMNQAKESSRSIQMALGGIGAVSLFVAAIGIANTMMMSIYERTKEIGVMKVLGCDLSAIRNMFLTEAGFIGLIGGAVGLILSFCISGVINFLTKSMYMEGSYGLSYIPPYLVLLALVFAVVIGMLAGLFPALRAMRLSPLAAIRNE